MKLQKLIVICATLLMTGCVSEDYHISADSGKVYGTCYTKMGKAIEFQRSGAAIQFAAGKTGLIIMSISLEDGDSAVIPHPTVLLSSSVHGESQILSADTYYWYEGGIEKPRPTNEPFVGSTHRLTTIFGVATLRRKYYFRFHGNKKLPDAFEITPPTILINGKPIKLPKITYKWESHFEIPPINC